MDVSGGKRSLPKSAYRPLEEGEVYTPYIPSDSIIPEITVRSVVIGAIMAAIFTLATAVSGLRAGQVFEAAIPIAILAIGIGKVFRRHNTILENVIIQSIGSASGVVVAGAIFTLPTLFMLELNADLLTMFITSLLGGVLGIVLLIPLRRYFVKDMHGQFPFPEATAVNEILVTGEKAGNQAGVLSIAMILGGLFDFLADGLKFWNSKFEWGALGGFFHDLTEKTKMVFKMDALAFFVGLGYIVGIKYSTIIVMGSFMSWFVFVPLIGWFFSNFPDATLLVGKTTLVVDQMTADAIFSNFVRNIGIGAIAAAGIIGILKSMNVIISSFAVGFKGILGKKEDVKTERVDTDMSMTVVLGIIGLAIVGLGIFFYFITGNMLYTVVGLLIAFVISFLFTTVAARAIAIVGTNPVSGMTLMTLILTSAILVSIGLTGETGQFVALIIGGVVCTALSMSGAFVSDLKVGYWLGSTPAKQQQWKFLGTIIAALVVGGAIILINTAFPFSVPLDPVTGVELSPVQVEAGAEFVMGPNKSMPAPQANVMKTIITTLMDPEAKVAWMIFGVGVLLAIILDRIGVPALAFGLGMYLPMELNTPLLLGAFIAYFLSKSSKDKDLAQARVQKGTLIASGFIAGTALFKIVESILKIYTFDELNELGAPITLLDKLDAAGNGKEFLLGDASTASIFGLVLVFLLCGWVFWSSMKAQKSEE
jgi:putative OPT family oligopeptide transporter